MTSSDPFGNNIIYIYILCCLFIADLQIYNNANKENRTALKATRSDTSAEKPEFSQRTSELCQTVGKADLSKVSRRTLVSTQAPEKPTARSRL